MTARALTEDQQRIRAYLLGQGEKYAWEELWPRVVSTRLELLRELDGVTEEQAAFRPAGEGAWTLAEALQHVLQVTELSMSHVERLANGQEPEAGAADPPAERAARSFAEMRRALLHASVRLAGLPAHLPDDPPLDATAPHAMFGDLHCKAWFIFHRVHEVDHVNQFREIKASPGFPAAG